jgi:para-nitrobenzyl esterase
MGTADHHTAAAARLWGNLVRTRSRLLARLALSTANIAVVAAGCSDDGDDTTESTPETTEQTTYEGARVATAKGVVLGGVETETQSRSFLGIPYAAPPVGEGRWAPPRPAAPWTSPRSATAPGAACEQNVNPSFGTPSVPISEDCLFLNVHTPARSTKALPVMVWFHGGGYTGGQGADYDARPLVRDHDLIAVTVNYRLGVFGFLATSGLSATAANEASGNYGIQDQRAALEWVRDNIEAFGGDPDRVTIVGESAGAGSVCVHTVSPQSRGLFHGAIMQSGSCAGSQPTATLREAEALGDAFAEGLGCGGTDASAAACLRAKPAAEIRAAGGGGSTGGATALPLRPIVDDVVVPDQPATLLRNGKFNQVPVINGFNSDEGSIFVYLAHVLQAPPVSAEGYRDAVAAMFAGLDADAIVGRYPLTSYRTPNNALAAARTDSSICRIDEATALYARHVPTYSYEFADRTAPFLGGEPESLDIGAGHGMEMQYLFESGGIPLVRTIIPEFDAKQQAVSDSMTAYWAGFIANHTPGRSGGPAWPRFKGAGGQRLVLGSDATTVEPAADDHQCDFWLG